MRHVTGSGIRHPESDQDRTDTLVMKKAASAAIGCHTKHSVPLFAAVAVYDAFTKVKNNQPGHEEKSWLTVTHSLCFITKTLTNAHMRSRSNEIDAQASTEAETKLRPDLRSRSAMRLLDYIFECTKCIYARIPYDFYMS
jgi:thiosulfate reductase cytochrome b subunit